MTNFLALVHADFIYKFLIEEAIKKQKEKCFKEKKEKSQVQSLTLSSEWCGT